MAVHVRLRRRALGVRSGWSVAERQASECRIRGRYAVGTRKCGVRADNQQQNQVARKLTGCRSHSH